MTIFDDLAKEFDKATRDIDRAVKQTGVVVKKTVDDVGAVAKTVGKEIDNQATKLAESAEDVVQDAGQTIDQGARAVADLAVHVFDGAKNGIDELSRKIIPPDVADQVVKTAEQGIKQHAPLIKAVVPVIEAMDQADINWIVNSVVVPIVTGQVTGADAQKLIQELAAREFLRALLEAIRQYEDTGKQIVVPSFALGADCASALGLQGNIGIAGFEDSAAFVGGGGVGGLAWGWSAQLIVGLWIDTKPIDTNGFYAGLEVDLRTGPGVGGGAYIGIDFEEANPFRFQGIAVCAGGGVQIQIGNLAVGYTHTWPI